MNKGVSKNVLFVFLLTLTIFSVVEYVSSLKEKQDLLRKIDKMGERQAVLEKEKQNLLQGVAKEKERGESLSQENSELRDNLRAGKRRLARLFVALSEAQRQNHELNPGAPLLKSEDVDLREQQTKLKLELSRIREENNELKARFNSVAELKKAIKELKIKKRKEKVTAEVEPEVPAKKTIEGNRGFMMKDSKFTYPAKVKIEVIPAPRKE
jgi:chromosome segregation ATPase